MNGTPRICVLAERHRGIGSAAAALEPHVRRLSDATWADVTYSRPDGWIERLPFPGRTGGVLRGFLQTGAALRAGPFDALLFLTHNPAVLRQRAVGRTPTLLWTDVTPEQLDTRAEQHGHPVDSWRWIRGLKRTLVRSTFRRAALCVGWSEWARRSFVDDYGIPEARTLVVPPGIDLARWTFPPREDHEGGPPRLLFVGADFARKGGHLLLEVFQAHLRGRCTVDVVTQDPVPAGEGVRVHKLTAGSPELLALYRRASVFVLPTLADCFSIAALEAMAMGLPVVISSLGGIPDIVEEGRSGYLIPRGDGAGLRAALERTLIDPQQRRTMGRRGRALVEQKLDARKTAEQLLQLLTGIARRERATPRGRQ